MNFPQTRGKLFHLTVNAYTLYLVKEHVAPSAAACAIVWAVLQTRLINKLHCYVTVVVIPPHVVQGGILSLLFVFLCVHVRLRISQPRFYRLAWNSARRFGLISDRFSPILGVAPGMAEFWASAGRHMAGYASWWSMCGLYCFLFTKILR